LRYFNVASLILIFIFEVQKCRDYNMVRFIDFFSCLVRYGIVICIVGFLVQHVSAQSSDSRIDLDLISKKKVRQFIVEHDINGPENYNRIQASWLSGNDLDDYHFQEKVFTFKEPLTNVWECYNTANPVQSWDGRKIDFGLLISKYTNSLLYESKGSFSAIDTGQVYILNLKLLKGIYNIPVAFEITNIDSCKKIIEFSYIEGNVSKGKQILQFIKLDDHTTEIIHQSYFLSDSHLRDEVYPFYHKKIIKDFHRNMKHLIKQNS
jgi:hypothetical protein